MNDQGDIFNIPAHARLSEPDKHGSYAAIAAVYDGVDEADPIGYALVSVSLWTSREEPRSPRTRPAAEVLFHRLDAHSSVPDDGIIGDDDPAYEALGRGQLLWTGRAYKLLWLPQDEARHAYSEYFA